MSGTAWLDFADEVLDLALAARPAPALPDPRQPSRPQPLRSGSDGIPAADSTATDERSSLHVARQRFHASLTVTTPFSSLVANAELDTDEAEVLAVAVASAMSLRRQRLVAFLQHEPTRTQLTVQTLASLFGPEHAGATTVGYSSGLRRAALIDLVEDGAWGEHTVVVAPGVVWALIGDRGVDPELPYRASTFVVDPDAGAGAGTETGTGTETATGTGTTKSSFVVVFGRDRLRRRQTAAAAAAATRFIVTAPPDTLSGWAALVREATLTNAGIILEATAPLSIDGFRWIDRATHLTWVLSSVTAPDLADLPRRDRIELEARDHTPTDEEWQATFGPEQQRTHPVLAEQLDDLGRTYAAHGGNLDRAVRRLVGSRLEKLARRIRPQFGWDDIVLSPERLEQLREITVIVRNAPQVYREWGFSPGHSQGIVALFSGPSGSGKTLAAEVVANDLHLDIFKLDMSAVVSKYIGETEKNLEEIFDAASAGNLVLFFDEADALLGKRSEVSDARDRYANIEVSYLLQRLERYDGIVILATNFEKNIDGAFLRRISTRVEFALPGEQERLAIWRMNLPAAAPRGDIDLAELARRFALSGASIKNAAVHAGFLAAAAGTPITTEHLVRGIARDHRKFGRLIRPDDFGEYYALLTGVPVAKVDGIRT